ncbi:helix-turn-helix domain-containing protein [Nakamurella aerolata]|uniref:helix-turn-helix domain-containing protein n=1 Tax=Nakamurella aerolata TaxID=1656892 RepID=UPI003CCD28A8
MEPLWRNVSGQVLRRRRRAMRRTLQRVADTAGISPQYLSEVERGRKEPSSEMLASICGALDWTLGELLAAGQRQLTVGQAAEFTVIRLGQPLASGPWRPAHPNSARSNRGGITLLAA